MVDDDIFKILRVVTVFDTYCYCDGVTRKVSKSVCFHNIIKILIILEMPGCHGWMEKCHGCDITMKLSKIKCHGSKI